MTLSWLEETIEAAARAIDPGAWLPAPLGEYTIERRQRASLDRARACLSALLAKLKEPSEIFDKLDRRRRDA